MINTFTEKIFLPLNDQIHHLQIRRYFSFLEASQWWSPEEIRNFQEQRFSLLVNHIYSKVPYYKSWFKINNLHPEDFKSISDLSKLPVLSKDDFRKSPDLFRSDDFNTRKVVTMNSSGSTGEPFRYYIDTTAYSIRYAAALRGWYWMGYKLGDFYVKLSQNRRISYIKRLQDFFNRCYYIFIPDLSINELKNVIKQVENTRPEYLRCYPDPLMLIARILKNEGRYLEGVKAINTTGNVLTKEARELIEDRFRCRIYDSYSCEGSALFYQGPESNEYLGSSEYAITEVLNNKGEEVSPGEPGFHVTTDLWNFNMPFIRYNTQDLVVKAVSTPKCGRKLVALESVAGRDNDILVTPSGDMLIVHLFTIYFEYINSVKQFQIEQSSLQDFTIRMVVNESFSDYDMRKIRDDWQTKLGPGVKLDIKILDSIPLLNSGKRRFLIRSSDVKLPL